VYGKVLAVQLYGVQTDMDEQLRTVCAPHAQCMLGGEQHGDLSVCRRIDFAVFGQDSRAQTERTL